MKTVIVSELQSLLLFAGESEGEEQAGDALARHHKGEHHPCERALQRSKLLAAFLSRFLLTANLIILIFLLRRS